jgi:tetratricopeptide (TPR) repeat protein/transcriptional regulator with XRE-family HTH domain
VRGVLSGALRRLRLAAGLTQDALAERSGISVRTIRRLEAGHRSNPRMASIERLAAALNLDTRERRELLTAALGNDAAGPGAQARQVPRQLPAAPSRFVGRIGDLSSIAATGTTLITGSGGIGKTWLALCWAHRNAHRFPDGQLFVDLRGFSPDSDPLEHLTALHGFLLALGVAPTFIPADLDARAAMYRSKVADKHMLVVLDNASTADQVGPLLPGSDSCVVLVTSRRRQATLITRYGAHHHHLDTLTRGESRALLLDGLGRVPEAENGAIDELSRLCGGYPLALAIMARHARTRPRIPAGEFAAELRSLGLDALDHEDPSASLPNVLSWSVRGLTSEQRVVFALLGIAPGPDISLSAAASLVGLAEVRTSTVLTALEDGSLLARQPGNRYSMHDLIRELATATARRDLDENVRCAALKRVCNFYTWMSLAAAELLAPHYKLPSISIEPPKRRITSQPLPDTSAAMTWFDTEYINLKAAQHTAAAQGWHHTVWQLVQALDTYQFRRGHRHDRLVAWQVAQDAAQHLTDPGPRIRARRMRGRACADLDRFDEAISYLHEALALAKGDNNATQQAHTHRTLAWTYMRQGNRQQAIEHATNALDLFRTVDEPVWEAHALNTVGWNAAQLGDYDTARSHCEVSLTMHQQLANPAGIADTADSLGYIAHHTGHHRRAIRYYKQAYTLYQNLTNTYLAADVLDHLGHAHAALEHHNNARSAWQQALLLYQEQEREHDANRIQRQLDAEGP